MSQDIAMKLPKPIAAKKTLGRFESKTPHGCLLCRPFC